MPQRKPRGGPFLAALSVAAVLSALAPWRLPLSSDGLLMTRTAAALAFEGTFRLPGPGPGAALVPWYFHQTPDGAVVAIYPPGGALWRAAVLKAAVALPGGTVRGTAADLSLSAVPILCTALTVLPLGRLLRYGGASPRMASWLSFGLLTCTFAGPLGVSDFSEPLLVLLLTAALERALGARRARGPVRALGGAADAAPSDIANARRYLACGLLFGAAVVVKPGALVLGPALALALLSGRRPRSIWRDGLAIFAGALPGLVVQGLASWQQFGDPLVLAHHQAGASRLGLAWTALRLLVLPNRGLLWFAPLLLLAAVALRAKARRSHRSPDRAAGLLAAVAFFALNCLWWAWEGGFGWGPRLLAPCVALLAPALPPPRPGRGFRGLAVALALIGFALNLPGYLLGQGRLYEDVARRPQTAPPLGPVLQVHRNAGAPQGLEPLQRLHYVPGSASWLVAPPILARLLAGAEPIGEHKDAAVLRLLLGRPVRAEWSDVGRHLLTEAQVSMPADPRRALLYAGLALDFGGPPVDARVLSSYLLVTLGRPDEAVRICREGLALAPDRPELRQNLAAALAAIGRRPR